MGEQERVNEIMNGDRKAQEDSDTLTFNYRDGELRVQSEDGSPDSLTMKQEDLGFGCGGK